MSHSPYLNGGSVYRNTSRSFSQDMARPPYGLKPQYMNYHDRYMDDNSSAQLVTEEKNATYVITPLNIISAGLCIAVFGLCVAWFGWPDRFNMLFKDLGFHKKETVVNQTQKPTAIKVDEGFYSANLSGQGFLIPGHKLRHIHRDDSGTARRIDLFTSMTPEKNEAKKTEVLPSLDRDKIFISLSAASTTMTPETRLETTYKYHLADEGVSTSLGLTLYRFKDNTGYQDQELYTGTLPDGPYVSVCFDDMAGLNASRCLASAHIGQNMVARYNFDRSHIKNWKSINMRVRETVTQLKIGE